MRAIVPAYNEESTVGAVVRALLRAQVFDDVVVVDDGSRDSTSAVAEDAGATVIRPERNLGKGGAMLYAVQNCCDDDEHIAFFDADLIGFEPYHAVMLTEAIDQGYDMACGLRDWGEVQNVLQLAFPVITGERILARWIIDALPATCWSGYSIETAMNHVANQHGGRTALVFFDGVTVRTKLDKGGRLAGIYGHCKMALEILRTRKALRSNGGLSCRP